METSPGQLIRNARPSDYPRVIEVMDYWWDGRPMSSRLSRVFFEHFESTCFVAEVKGRLVGFVLGFLSQSNRDEAYIHFVGVHPDYRRLGVGKLLYRRFFAAACEQGRSVVRSSTSPVNSRSIAFHRALGFALEPGDATLDGVAVHSDYPLPGESRVRFVRDLSASVTGVPRSEPDVTGELIRVA
jgi:ribosomal protein S18 acetylase RimI-like enzyme